MDILIQEFTKDRFVSELTIPIVCFRIFLAILFGGIVGFEREKNNRPAGFRTHILVCFGAAIVSMIEDQLRINLLLQYGSTGLNLALGRLGAQVISGIGFLGAGSIMKDKGETIGGMTTAAGIWATGCVGLCIGWGFHNIALVAIFFMLIVMVSFKKIESKLIKKSRDYCKFTIIPFKINYSSSLSEKSDFLFWKPTNNITAIPIPGYNQKSTVVSASFNKSVLNIKSDIGTL